MATSTALPGATASWRRVHHPAFVAALAVLVVNDRLLKTEWPGVLSGKLSDLAGLFLLGALGFDALDSLGARARWRPVFATAVATVFALVKLIAPVTALARSGSAHALDLLGAVLGWLPTVPADGSGARIVTDPSDLLALPALLLPLLLSSQAHEHTLGSVYVAAHGSARGVTS